ncbi:MAG: acyl-CoA dehydrogenase, partial [Actinobacteria bacterium]|nr:acyl-CoA dehydrogenase [Actinomycetota bacterium]
TLGGSGFLQDYPIEQYIRDAKIDSLYEGTTAIQGLDLFFRKILRNEGRALRALLGDIRGFAASEAGNGRLKTERAALGQAAHDVEAMASALGGYALASLERPEEIYKAGLNTTRLLLALGDLVIGWLLARQADVALAALDAAAQDGTARPAQDAAFYQGKLATARFFAQTVLPRLAVERQIAEETTLDLMELPEAAF